MHFTISSAEENAIRALCIGLLSLWPFAGQAMPVASPPQNLPELPASDTVPGYFSLDEQSAELGYDSRFQKWGAKLDEYSYLNPSLTLDYGMVLTSKFGAGATVTRHSGYSELLVNGVYAPKRNLRIKIANSQMRTSSAEYPSAGQSNGILQDSYLLDFKRNSSSGKLLSDVGLTAYTVQARGANGAAHSPDLTTLEGGMVDATDVSSSTLEAGRLDGYALNLGLQPTLYSRIELRRERSRLTYHLDDGNRGDDYRDANRISYSQYFNNCSRFQGRYSNAADADRLDLSLAKNSWSVGLSRALDSSSRDTTLQIAYAIPLGRSRAVSGDCGAKLAKPRVFESLVDAATARPRQLPRESLADAIAF
jgi:hypothetical protein